MIEVPVQVLQNGEPLRGLTAADFEIRDGRKEREITGFEVVDLTISEAAATPQTGLAGPARRHFLLLFDLSFSDPAAIVRAREAAVELLREGLHASDLVAVASYSRSSGAQLIIGFSPDREQVELAIETLGLPQLVETRRDPLGLTFTNPNTPERLDRGAGLGLARELEAELETLLTQMDSSNRRASDRNEILALTGALTELAEMMQAVDGKKYVVFLSEGFNSSVLLGTRGSTAEEQRAIEEQNEAAVQGHIWDVDSNVRFGDTWSQSQLGEMLQEFIRADCMIQAVDIGGVRAAGDARPRQSSEDGLFIMADSTGGDFYRNFNDLDVAMTKMLERTSVTYLLAFQPPNLRFDGSYHKLKVRLKKGPKGARLIHRPGYFAPRSMADLSGTERQLTGASQIFSAPGGQVDTAVLAAAFDVEMAEAYVPVLIEVGGDSLLIGHSGDVVPAEIYAYAIASDGRVGDFFAQSLGLDLRKVGPALEHSGFKLWGQFELPPGSYTARVMVRNSASGATGVDVFPFVVPDFDSTEQALLAPLLPEPTGKWLLIRQDGAQQGGFDYPFMLADEPFIPAARPEMRPGQQVRLSLVAYNSDLLSPVARGSLLRENGDRVTDVEIELHGHSSGSVAGMDRFAGTFVVPGLDPGRYRLEVTLGDSDFSTTVSSVIPVRITG